MKLNKFINGNIRETTIRAYIDVLNTKYKLWASYNNIWLDEYNSIDRKRNQFERFLEMEVKSLPENFKARIYFEFENLSDSPLNAICTGNYRSDCYEFKLSEYHSYREETK